MTDPVRGTPLRIGDLLRALDGAATIDASLRLDTPIRGASTDSRTIAPGEVFFALRGRNTSGHRFVRDALARGAAAAVVDRSQPVDAPRGAPLIRVRDPLHALGRLAAHHRDRLSATVIAITGSTGKTTTRELLRQILEAELPPGSVCCAERSFNNAIGVPLTVLRAHADTRVLLCELGTSGPGEIAALGRMVGPDLAVITNIAPAHLEGLGSVDGVAREKISLLSTLRTGGLAVLNRADRRLRSLATSHHPTLWFGPEPDAGLWWHWEAHDAGGWLTVQRRGHDPVEIELPFPGRHNAANAAAALACCVALGIPLRRAARPLQRASLPPRRQQPLSIGGIHVIDDAYNANPSSVKAAIDVLCELPTRGRRIVVLGGMHELGRESVALHGGIGTYAATREIDLLLTVGPLAEPAAHAAHAAGMPPERALACPTVESAAERLCATLAPGDRVLVKASRCERLERLVATLRQRLAPSTHPGDPARRPNPTPGQEPAGSQR